MGDDDDDGAIMSNWLMEIRKEMLVERKENLGTILKHYSQPSDNEKVLDLFDDDLPVELCCGEDSYSDSDGSIDLNHVFSVCDENESECEQAIVRSNVSSETTSEIEPFKGSSITDGLDHQVTSDLIKLWGIFRTTNMFLEESKVRCCHTDYESKGFCSACKMQLSIDFCSFLKRRSNKEKEVSDGCRRKLPFVNLGKSVDSLAPRCYSNSYSDSAWERKSSGIEQDLDVTEDEHLTKTRETKSECRSTAVMNYDSDTEVVLLPIPEDDVEPVKRIRQDKDKIRQRSQQDIENRIKTNGGEQNSTKPMNYSVASVKNDCKDYAFLAPAITIRKRMQSVISGGLFSRRKLHL